MWAGALRAKPYGGRNVQQDTGWGQWGGVGCYFGRCQARAKGTSTPRHISSCGPPAAQISYFKPEQICREQACNINQLSLLRILIKQMPEAQGILGAELGAEVNL